MDSSFASLYLRILLFQIPIILAGLGGIVVAVLLWRRSLLAAVLCLLATTGLVVLAVLVPGIYSGLSVWSREWSSQTSQVVYPTVNVVLNGGYALLLALLLSAALAGRSRATR